VISAWFTGDYLSAAFGADQLNSDDTHPGLGRQNLWVAVGQIRCTEVPERHHAGFSFSRKGAAAYERSEPAIGDDAYSDSPRVSRASA
jgi:hypothetical protein